MFDTIIKGTQFALVIAWIAMIYNLFFPFPGMAHTILLYAIPVMVIGHFAEWLAVRGKLKQLKHEGPVTLLLVIMFGFAWWLPILKSQQADAGNQGSVE